MHIAKAAIWCSWIEADIEWPLQIKYIKCDGFTNFKN